MNKSCVLNADVTYVLSIQNNERCECITVRVLRTQCENNILPSFRLKHGTAEQRDKQSIDRLFHSSTR